jgi:hypothetical protein
VFVRIQGRGPAKPGPPAAQYNRLYPYGPPDRDRSRIAVIYDGLRLARLEEC